MKSRNSSPASAGRDSNTLVTVSEVAEQVGREILESRLEPGAWATALYECDGKRQDALAVYTRLRVRQLTKQRRVRLAKVSSFESRKLAICMGDQATRDSIARTVQEMLGHGGPRGKSRNFAKPRMSLIWMGILFFGTAGTVASFGRLFSHLLPDSITSPLTLVSLLAGVGVVWSAMVLRYYLPKRWIMLGWNSGLVLTCNVLCLCSVFLGTKVIKRAVASGASPLAVEQQAVVPVRMTPESATSQNRPVRTSIRKSANPKEPYLVSATPEKSSGKQ